MSTTRNAFQNVRGLALVALMACTARAGSTEYAEYAISGIGPGGPISGVVQFGTDTVSFNARFNQAPVALGPTYTAAGNYTELNLFVIGFWSFTGNDMGGSASGAGIRLLFGLLVFGSHQDSTGGTYLYSGIFDSIVNVAPRDEVPERAAIPEEAAELAALLRRCAFAIERR